MTKSPSPISLRPDCGPGNPHRAVSRVLAAHAVTAVGGHRESPQQWIARNWPSWRPHGVEAEIIKTAAVPASTTGWGGRDRIDGAVACWMAVSRAAAGDSNISIYSDATARPEGFLFV